jgi:hypothetical protein
MAKRRYALGMHAKAHVVNGRIVFDEPTTLPEGTTLEVLDFVVVDTGDDLDETERARLHAALAEAVKSVKAGHAIDGVEVLRRLSSRS